MNHRFIGPRIIAIGFVTLMGAFGLNLSAGQFFTPLHDAYGWSLTTLSLAVSLNMITWGLFQPITGRLIDKYGPKPVIAASSAIMGCAFLLCVTITEMWQFFLYYGLLTAVGFAGCGSMACSVLVSRWYVKKRAAMLARSSMGMNIGQLLLLPLTGIFIAYADYRTAFLVLGCLMLIVVVPLVLFGTYNSPHQIGQSPDGDSNSSFTPPRSTPLSEALRTREFWLASLGFVTCGYTLYLVTIHLPKFAVDLGGSSGLGGQLLGIAALFSTISMWITGQLTHKISKRKLLIGLYSIRTLSFMWIALASELWQLYVFAGIYGISSMPIIPLVTGMIGDRFGANALGSILGSAWLLHQIFASVGVFLGGYLRTVTGTYAAAFWSGAGLLVIGTILTMLIHENAMKPQLPANQQAKAAS